MSATLFLRLRAIESQAPKKGNTEKAKILPMPKPGVRRTLLSAKLLETSGVSRLAQTLRFRITQTTVLGKTNVAIKSVADATYFYLGSERSLLATTPVLRRSSRRKADTPVRRPYALQYPFSLFEKPFGGQECPPYRAFISSRDKYSYRNHERHWSSKAEGTE